MKTLSQKGICILTFTAGLFIITKKKLAGCPLTDE